MQDFALRPSPCLRKVLLYLNSSRDPWLRTYSGSFSGPGARTSNSRWSVLGPRRFASPETGITGRGHDDRKHVRMLTLTFVLSVSGAALDCDPKGATGGGDACQRA
ncbi:para-aminobenzoic acid synthetase [Moniliophthora roreri]|nr:para-aminobenzoic acid synthetase [Moniliophthora roreri]